MGMVTVACGRIMFGTTETAIAGVGCGQFGIVRLKFHYQLPSEEPPDTEVFERESRLAARQRNWDTDDGSRVRKRYK
jgi:hypothetical protein